jgi:hypothetical protein
MKDQQTRIRRCILLLRNQVKNPSILDQFLSCLSTSTAIDGRLPFTPVRVICTPDKSMLLHNIVGHAILQWGANARKENDNLNPHIAELEQIVTNGLALYGAYPKERNSAIHVLRLVSDERKLVADRATAQEKALEMKANQRAGGLDDGEDTKEAEGGARGDGAPA